MIYNIEYILDPKVSMKLNYIEIEALDFGDVIKKFRAEYDETAAITKISPA